MNFKFTKTKTIASIIILIILDIFTAFATKPQIRCDIAGASCIQPTPQFFHPYIILISLAFTIVIYVIWSIIQKK